MATPIVQPPTDIADLQSFALLALRSATVVAICLIFAYFLFQKTWLLAVVCGILAGLGVLYLTQPIAHHPAISDSYD